MRQHILAWSLTAMLVSSGAQAQSSASRAADEGRSGRITEAARQAWAITDVVLEKDIDPPARQQMLLHGLKAVLTQKSAKIPANLASRVSAVTTPDQFAALLAEVCPADDAEAKRGSDTQEARLFEGLFGWQSAEEHGRFYLSPRDVKAHEMIAGNRYVGTGIQIRKNDKEKLTQIVIPFPGGPARKAGARPGDLIVEVRD